MSNNNVNSVNSHSNNTHQKISHNNVSSLPITTVNDIGYKTKLPSN